MNGHFSVESVTERPTLNAAGQLVNQTIIFLRTGRGATGSLNIPTSDYEALTSTEEGKEVLRGLIRDKAAALDAPFEM